MIVEFVETCNLPAEGRYENFNCLRLEGNRLNEKNMQNVQYRLKKVKLKQRDLINDDSILQTNKIIESNCLIYAGAKIIIEKADDHKSKNHSAAKTNGDLQLI